MKLVLDTNIYSDYAEGLPQPIDFMATYGEFIFYVVKRARYDSNTFTFGG